MILAVILLLSLTAAAYASGIRELFSLHSDDQPVKFSIHAEFGKLPQFDENRTEKLNRLLRHIAFTGILDGEQSSMDVLLDGEPLFSITEKETGENAVKMITTDSGLTYILPEDAQENESQILKIFSSITDQMKIRYSIDIYADLLGHLPEYFQELCKSGKILEKYKDYGTAVQKISIRIPAEEFEKYIQDYLKELPEGQCVPDPRSILFTGRQDFELLTTEDGKTLKIRYGGTAGFSENDLRTVRLEWKTVRNDLVEKDELTLKTPDSNGTKRNNLVINHTRRITEEGKETFSWKAETDSLSERTRTRGTILCSVETENGIVSGSFSETVTVRNETKGSEIIFEASGDPDDQCTGTLEIISKKDKIENERLKAEFSITTKVPVSPGNEPEPASITGNETADIRQQLISNTLKKLMKLPEEDLVFLAEGIPEESLKMILQDYETIKEPVQ